MAHEEKLEDVVRTRLLRLNATVQALVVGILAGLLIFVATNWLILKGGHLGPEGERVVGPHLSLLSQFFVGYSVTFLGSLVGFAYAFILGFIIAYGVAAIYNWFVDLKERKSQGA
jgi:hypothetical protein